MRLASVCSILLFSLPVAASAQQSPGSIRSTRSTCSSNSTGNNNHVTINCKGVGKEQGDEIVKLINKALARQDPTEALQRLNEKADEIIDAINPNLATVTYNCEGVKRSHGPSADAAEQTSMSFEPTKDFQALEMNYNNSNYQQITIDATRLIRTEPYWLTPRLFLADAYARQGRTEEATQLVDYYEKHKGPAYDKYPCTDFLAQVHRIVGK